MEYQESFEKRLWEKHPSETDEMIAWREAYKKQNDLFGILKEFFDECQHWPTKCLAGDTRDHFINAVNRAKEKIAALNLPNDNFIKGGYTGKE